MTEEELLAEIDNDIETLTTTRGEEVDCISIENLLGILKRLNITH
jgi:hypothetical protein